MRRGGGSSVLASYTTKTFGEAARESFLARQRPLNAYYKSVKNKLRSVAEISCCSSSLFTSYKEKESIKRYFEEKLRVAMMVPNRQLTDRVTDRLTGQTDGE